MTDVDDLRGSIYAAARERYDHVYANPVGVIIVPWGRTSVTVAVERVDDLLVVNIRAAVLQNLRGRPDLFEYVALQATQFRLGSLYLFREGDGYDLDVESRTLAHWTAPREVADLIAVVGATAEEQALHLRPRFGGTVVNPSETAERRVYAEKAWAENTVVADALGKALDVERCTITGAVEGAWITPGDAVLGRVVFAMTTTDLWLAGWPRHAQEPAVWRIPYTDITEDHVRQDQGATDYLARVAQGRWLGIRVIEPDTADAIRRVRSTTGSGSPSTPTGSR
ncbi:hypothetical protein [Actinomycetospora chiangmaiensis]|uniref:hypothetical protein n=1 Tax=Actinomycetospora chiangmaiensis TaxID=402650 RepID=UPI000373726C|nr:hypothetical protein [Actinomycetospora chiangmaiensis]